MVEYKVSWTVKATVRLKDILEYRKQFNKVDKIRKLRRQIFDRTRPLKTLPRLGVKDLALSDEENEYRFLIERPYKIVYMVLENQQEIKVVDVFDTRRRK